MPYLPPPRASCCDRPESSQVPGGLTRLRQITATGEDMYEVSFDGAPETMTFTVVEIRGIRGANPHPDLFMSGRFGDPRPIVRAVLAVHDARQGQALA